MALNMLYNSATGKMIVSNTKNLYVVDARIKIATYEDLIKIGVDDDYPIDADYLQIADITQPSTTASHVPIALEGTYDGGFFELKDFVINSTADVVGIFGSCGSDSFISNVIVNSATITGNANTYYAGAIVGNSLNTIDNCLVINSSITISTLGSDVKKFGVAIGQTKYGYTNIQTSNNTLTTPMTFVGGLYTGGIAGGSTDHDNDTSIVSNCISTKNNLIHKNNYRTWCGGIAGVLGKTTVSIVSNCFSASTLTNDNDDPRYAEYHRWAIGYSLDNVLPYSNNFYDKDIFENESASTEKGTGLTTFSSKLVSSYPTWDISYKASDLDTKFRIDISGTINDGYPYLTQFETALINGGV